MDENETRVYYVATQPTSGVDATRLLLVMWQALLTKAPQGWPIGCLANKEGVVMHAQEGA